jgi:hypothetical protein
MITIETNGGALFFNEAINWEEKWGRLKGLGNDHIASGMWSQLRLNFWSPFLEKHQWRNTNQSGKCNICDNYQNEKTPVFTTVYPPSNFYQKAPLEIFPKFSPWSQEG